MRKKPKERDTLVERIAVAIFDADHGPHAGFGIALVTHTNKWETLVREDADVAEGYRSAARAVLKLLKREATP